MKNSSNPELWRVIARWPGEDIFEEYEYNDAHQAAYAAIFLRLAGWIISIKLDKSLPSMESSK